MSYEESLKLGISLQIILFKCHLIKMSLVIILMVFFISYLIKKKDIKSNLKSWENQFVKAIWENDLAARKMPRLDPWWIYLELIL